MKKILEAVKNRAVRKLFVILTHIAVISIVIYFYTYENRTDKLEELYGPDDLLCHYFEDQGCLKALDENTVFHPNPIFFIESSCQGLTSRQACSIESAARANPRRQVVVLFTSPMSWEEYKRNGLSILLSLPNIEAARIHIQEFSKDTPFKRILNKKPLTPNDINMSIGDILKYLTIYKYSGTYLALDVLAVRSFDDLNSNWIVKETPASLSTDMFSFSNNKNGRALAKIALNITRRIILLEKRQTLWTLETVNTMNKLAKAWCYTSDVLQLETNMCKDLQVHEPDAFLPIPLKERQKYFQQGKWELLENKTIYTFQTFDYLTKFKIVPKNSLYDELAKQYCPDMFSFYGDHFGLY